MDGCSLGIADTVWNMKHRVVFAGISAFIALVSMGFDAHADVIFVRVDVIIRWKFLATIVVDRRILAGDAHTGNNAIVFVVAAPVRYF